MGELGSIATRVDLIRANLQGAHLDVAEALAVLQHRRLHHRRVALGHRCEVLRADVRRDAGVVADGDDGRGADSVHECCCAGGRVSGPADSAWTITRLCAMANMPD